MLRPRPGTPSGSGRHLRRALAAAAARERG